MSNVQQTVTVTIIGEQTLCISQRFLIITSYKMPAGRNTSGAFALLLSLYSYRSYYSWIFSMQPKRNTTIF